MPISRFGDIRIVVTPGDIGGIGPEVILKSLSLLSASDQKKITLLGSESFYSDLSKKLKLSFPSSVNCLPFCDFPKRIIRGQSVNQQTEIAVKAIETAVEMALEKKIDAIVTAPIHKAGLRKAGFDFPGHTEYLAKLSNTKNFHMMLVGGALRVLVVTRHIPINKVSQNLSIRNIEEAIVLADKELRSSFGIKRPRIVVCGLNPHAGEQGHIGFEEIKVIEPAVRAAQKKCKASIVGPLSPDSLFHDAYMGRYDAEICMYHDQGLIPLKMISRGAGVNVTLGLPFVRTSPDHGTGYDIAGKFIADSGSMKEAILLAKQISTCRRAQ